MTDASSDTPKAKAETKASRPKVKSRKGRARELPSMTFERVPPRSKAVLTYDEDTKEYRADILINGRLGATVTHAVRCELYELENKKFCLVMDDDRFLLDEVVRVDDGIRGEEER